MITTLKFLGIITDDYIFGDQCKICDIKEDYRDEVKGRERN
jgi:hypothetical protein